MEKIKSIKFRNHEILGDLYVDFSNANGNIVDTIIIAGENGTGKSTLLNELYKIATYKVDSEMEVEICIDEKMYKLQYYKKDNFIYIKNNIENIGVQDIFQNNSIFVKNTNFNAIYSDVDINFHSDDITYVTSLNIDSKMESRKSDNSITTQINQLIIDIQDLDDAKLAKTIRENKDKHIIVNETILSGRMERFISAFTYMFNDLKYDGIENIKGKKKIIFKRGEKKIPIENLSSGEKQIIYRGSFLLKDLNALNGALVLLDEPEISMHPLWQKKIMEFYKSMFTNQHGEQTSQIFAVTHSPFVLHSDQRINDKVLVLKRDDRGNIKIFDKPSYYKCDCEEAIEDAFNCDFLMKDENMVFLEGRTDEMYFNKALKVYDFSTNLFTFKWIGHQEEKGKEEFTGSDSLAKAYLFRKSINAKCKYVFLFDCDITKKEENKNNSFIKIMKKNVHNKRFKKGIENALNVEPLGEEFIYKDFYSTKEKEGDYGDIITINSFEKMKFCEYICGLNDELLKQIFINLKEEIDRLVELYSNK